MIMRYDAYLNMLVKYDWVLLKDNDYPNHLTISPRKGGPYVYLQQPIFKDKSKYYRGYTTNPSQLIILRNHHK